MPSRHPHAPQPLRGRAALLGAGCLSTTEPPAPVDPCEPNPCTQGDKTACVNDNGRASCVCKAGTILRPNGACEPLSAANCPEHAGDTAEPDDCLARAAPLATASSITGRTIEPVGDYDFFQIDGTARTIYTLTAEASAGSLLPRLDVFDPPGVWLTALDATTSPRVSLGFKARLSAPHYVRVSHSPRDPSPGTGAYTLTLAPSVVDDHGDTVTEATGLTPSPGGSTSPSTLSGTFEYGQDKDVFSFPVTLNAGYRVEFDTAGGRVIPALAAYIREDVRTPFRTAQNAFIEFRADSTTTVYLELTPPTGATASYSFRVLEFR